MVSPEPEQFAEKFRTQRAQQVQLVQDELRSIPEALTPEQRQTVRSYIETRMVRAPAAQTVTELVYALADKLGISTEQLTNFRQTHRSFVDQ